MKKFFVIISALALTMCASCGKVDKASDSNAPVSEMTEASTVQPDPLAPTSESSTDSADTPETTSADSQQVTTAATTEIAAQEQVDPLGGGSFSYDSNGAVVFDGDPSLQDDRVLISAAQALFSSACDTQWNFTVSCPYTIDTSNYIENDFGWRFNLITDDGISSYADVQKDYYKVFSSRYPDPLSSLYIENNGAVYALNAARGMNLYYSTSKITGIQSRTEDEIFFTVENYYDGSDRDTSTPYSETDTFSAVNENGVWKAGQFTLPY